MATSATAKHQRSPSALRLSSPPERGGGERFVIPAGAKRRAGTAEALPDPPGRPAGRNRATVGQSARCGPSSGSALTGCPEARGVNGARPGSRLRLGRDDNRSASGRSGGGCGHRGRGGWSGHALGLVVAGDGLLETQYNRIVHGSDRNQRLHDQSFAAPPASLGRQLNGYFQGEPATRWVKSSV